MASSLALRSYTKADRAAVLSLFDANVPVYFAADGAQLARGQPGRLGRTRLRRDRGWRGGGVRRLRNLGLLRQGASVLGCGAPAVPWPGLGRWLLAGRLALIAEQTPPTRWVSVDTSPKVAPFFLRQGFETASVWPHGYRTGGEMHVLRFDLATTTAETLKRRSGDAFQIAEARCG